MNFYSIFKTLLLNIKFLAIKKAILSFLKEVERTSVKVKQLSDICTKENYFKDYCFSIGIMELDNINLHTFLHTYAHNMQYRAYYILQKNLLYGIVALDEIILYLKSGFLKSMGASWFRRVYTAFWLHVEDFWLPPKSSGNNVKCRLRLRCCRLTDGSYLLAGVSAAG